MRKILAVAVLDIRRLWMAVGAFGVAVGISPAVSRAFGNTSKPDEIFPLVFGITGLVAGGAFGADFAEGKPSFFFARPLATSQLFAGRIAALAGLVLSGCLGFTVSHWLSGRQTLVESFVPITAKDLWALGVAWVVSLFFSLGVSANTRQTARRSLGAFMLAPLRIAASLAITGLMFGLFTDVVIRAFDSTKPASLLFGSYAVAAFLSSCVAIEMGRTDRLTITRVLNLGMYFHTALVFAAVAAAWAYILHPGPDAIRSISSAFSSPDGRVAYVSAGVDRGGARFRPVFSVDLGSGDVQRLPADWAAGPGGAAERPWLWHSRDGGTRVWAEQTPLLFRGIRRFLSGAFTGFRFRTSFGEERPLPMSDLAPTWGIREASVMDELPLDILPSSNGDLFAVWWTDTGKAGIGRHLAFMSPARGELAEVDLAAEKRFVVAWAFLPTGQLRAATLHRGDLGQRLEFVDIDPATGHMRVVASEEASEDARVLFDAEAASALIASGPLAARTISLRRLESSEPAQTLGTARDADFETSFLADGRIALLVRQKASAELRLFSREGKPTLNIALGAGRSTLGGEPFASVLSVATLYMGQSELSFLDSGSGKVLRRFPGLSAPPSWSWDAPPPPGSPGARLLISPDQKLYILPSLTEAPRLVLPRPRA